MERRRHDFVDNMTSQTAKGAQVIAPMAESLWNQTAPIVFRKIDHDLRHNKVWRFFRSIT
jgi:hypothetical protein